MRRFGFSEKIKNKLGMTYVELLVALTLLMVVLMAFTPMLISSYNNIAKAGIVQEEVYSAQNGIEAKLSERTNRQGIIYDYGVKLFNKNMAAIGDAININLRRATHGLTDKIGNSLESLFYKGKGIIEIVSAKHVNDDTVNKTVVIRAKGFKFDQIIPANPTNRPNKTRLSDDAAIAANGGEPYKYLVTIGAYAPIRTEASSELVYNKSNNILTSTDIHMPANANDMNEIYITLDLKNVDMTCSPIQIIVSYYDENSKMTDVAEGKKIKTATSYLYIDSPTLMIGSNTSSTCSYYTSTGITTTNVDNVTHSQLKIDKRVLNEHSQVQGLSDYQATIAIGMPGEGSTKIKSVSYITNDTDTGYNYYVLTGTNGTILRMYAPQNDEQYGKAKEILNTEPNTDINIYKSGSVKQNRVNRLKSFTLSDNGARKTIYPVFWSGDYSHQFGFSTYKKSMGYGGKSVSDVSCWYTYSGSNGVGNTGVFSTQARYAYMFNGEATGYGFLQQTSRRIAYLLTEKDYALRSGYEMQGKEDFNNAENYNRVWESDAELLYRGTIFDSHKSSKSNRVMKHDCDVGSPNVYEYELAQVRIKGLNTLSDTGLLMNYTGNKDQNKYPTTNNSASIPDSPVNYLGDGVAANRSNVNVTSAVFDPGLGGMFYCGSVNASTFVLQMDNLNTGSESQKVEYDNPPNGSYTGYYIFNNSDGKSSTIVKASTSNGKEDYGNYIVSSLKSRTTEATTTSNMTAFYLNHANDNRKLDGVLFTMGFSSNREKVYSKITYNGSKEIYKSYEIYYFLSHYGDTANSKVANYCSTYNNKGSSYRNSPDNDYYNVWFPGECYNLIKTANKEGVTVAVGYTVSGSVFQWGNPSNSDYNNWSTAVGGIFNDGVLAAKLETDSALTNLLYYKDAESFDNNSLSSAYTRYSNQFGTYGTHSRKSVQFTCVDLLPLSKSVVNNVYQKTYVAYYGTSTGRAFYSDIAYQTVTVSGSSATPTSRLVNFVSDLSSATGVKNQSEGDMTEVLVNNQRLDTIFNTITNISADGNTIIISGESKTSDCYVVVGTALAEEKEVDGKKVSSYTGAYTWKKVKIFSGSYKINDTCIVDGVYYAVGKYGSSGGFIAGVGLDEINMVVNGATGNLTAIVKTTDESGNNLSELYSIAGKGSTQK